MDLPITIKADVSESTNNALKELALPASKEIGQALGNVFGLFNTLTLPIKLANKYAQRNFKIYADKMNQIDKEKIKEVEPEIAVPIIEKLSYTSNEELANAYANLLANASNKEKVDLIHPGFIHKLQNLAPDEVKILEYLRVSKTNDIPYFIFKAVDPKTREFKFVSIPLTGIELELELNVRNTAAHFNNLVSLNILKDGGDSYKSDEKIYEQLREKYLDDENKYRKQIEKGELGKNLNELDIKKSYYSLTLLGNLFIEACVNE